MEGNPGGGGGRGRSKHDADPATNHATSYVFFHHFTLSMSSENLLPLFCGSVEGGP